MGFYVHLSVIMACDNNEELAEVAKKYIDTTGCHEAEWFLQDLSARTGKNPGPKGGLSFWGIVGNYSCADFFVRSLHPFWLELFKTEAGPFDFEHIIVFYEPEQSEMAEAYEISFNKDIEEVNITHHILPFAWMQM